MISQGASTGDPFVRFNVNGGQDYAFGVDNSDSDKLKIQDDADPSTGNNLWTMTSAGERTMPLQPAFSASLDTTDNNVTGAGTNYTLGTNVALTEVFDQNGDFNTNGTFTASVTGRYHLIFSVRIINVTAACTLGLITIPTSNRVYNHMSEVGVGTTRSANNGYVLYGAVLADMDVADTATFTVYVDGEAADTIDIGNGVSPHVRTFVMGYLVC